MISMDIETLDHTITVKSELVNDFVEESEQSLLAGSESGDENCGLNYTANYLSSVYKQRESYSAKSVTMAKAISPKDLLKIQCVICKEAIVIKKFQRHIALCGESNRAMQDMMEMRLKQILCNFNIITQRKVDCMLQMEESNEQSESVRDNSPSVNERRTRRDSAKPDYEFLRRGRSKSVFKDTRLNSSEQRQQDMNGISNSIPMTPVSVRSSLSKVADQNAANWSVFSKPSEAQSEISLLLQNSTFSCSLCSYTTDRKPRLQKHEWTHRIKKTQVLQCFYCSQRYTIGALAVHIRQVHTGQGFRFRKTEDSKTPLLACSQCSFQCHLQIQLNNHFKKVHTVVSKKCAPLPTKQLIVVLKKEDLEALQRGFERSARPKTDPIELPTIRPKHLNSKLPEVRDKASFKCTKCDFVTIGNVYYAAHMQTHTYQQNLMCECGFESTKGHLRKHKLRCPIALAYRRTIKNKLQKMPKVVTVQKARREYKFSCKMCSAKFSRISKLYSHVELHKRNEPIEKCDRCNYQSTHRCLLKHIKRSKHYTVGNWGMRPNNEKSDAIRKSYPVQAATKEKSPMKTVCLEAQKVPESPTDTNTSAVATKAPNLLLFGNGFQPEQSSTSPKSTATIGTDAVDEFACKVEACYAEDDLDETDQDGLRLIKCTLCSYFSTNEASYKRHVESHISRNFPIFKCQFCSFMATRSNFRYHRSRCAGFRKTMRSWKAPQKYMLHCAACPFTTYLPEDLNRHMYSCTNQVGT